MFNSQMPSLNSKLGPMMNRYDFLEARLVIFSICGPRGGGGHSRYILVGVCRSTSKKGGLRHGHNPKKGGLRHGYNPKKGGLRHGHESKKG